MFSNLIDSGLIKEALGLTPPSMMRGLYSPIPALRGAAKVENAAFTHQRRFDAFSQLKSQGGRSEDELATIWKQMNTPDDVVAARMASPKPQMAPPAAPTARPLA